ncbi:MAG: UDP-2,3-diacylglucosamine diphosphatase LpxI [Opitutales bacterium]|nr:UDP-2,3-diacylglucosamine diphosphatase LpxI [Opitutales bacterium]MCH8540239.1 UDP-2,3-diacylglucosamine diphosphatase LpxI [Opitutales bacterium]
MSRFLPDPFPAQPIALLAGKGQYPELLLERIRQAGHEPWILGYEDETSPELLARVPENRRATIKVGQLGKMLKILSRWPTKQAIMAGQITPRRLFRGLHPDLKAVAILARLKERNAETIFGAIAEEMEAIDRHLLDARAFMDEDLAEHGVMNKGRYQPPETVLQHGIHIAREIARLDIGQGVVVRKGTVLAVEAFEGTDRMLARAGTFPKGESLFVKTQKPQQDTRFDVPVFGLKTLEVMEENGLHAAALEAGKCLILDKSAVLREAARRKITLLGY